MKPRTAHLAAVLAEGARGRSAPLRTALRTALTAGVEPAALREALLMLAPFAGFPRMLDALAAFRAECDEPADAEPGLPEDDADRRCVFRARGRELFERVYGPDAGRVEERLLQLDPEVPAWIVEDAYGRVLARPGLPAAERECIAVAVLCALRLRNQLSGHVRGALLCGATPDEIRSCLAAADLPPDEVAAAEDALARAAGDA